jgi:ABC-2 type transport system permease protein
VGPFFKKDFIIYWRDRKEMLISLILPMVLIIVLGTVLPNWIEKSNESLQMTVAIVNEDNEAAGLVQFRDSLDKLTVPVESAASLQARAEHLLPIQSLMQMFNNAQTGQFVKTIDLDSATAQQRLQDKAVVAIISIPVGFTNAALNKMLLDEGSVTALSLTADHRASLRVDMLQDLLDGFMLSLNTQTAIDHSLSKEMDSLGPAEQTPPIGKRETIAGVAVLTSFQYYAIAISILFALFVSQTTALNAITEKREHVFQRILLTGSHPLRYLAGKVGSTFCMALLLITILILLSHFLFNLFPGRSLQFWLGISLILIMVSLCTAALSALFTSLIFRMKDAAASGLFTLVLTLFGMIGGNFIPIYLLPDWLKQVGEWTPNGLALSVFIQWIQQDSFAVLTAPFLKLTIFAIVIISIGTLLFPKRGRI